MKKYALYVNYLKEDKIDNFIEKLKEVYGNDQVIAFDEQVIYACTTYMVIITPDLLEKLEYKPFIENIISIKNNKQSIIPLILNLPNNEDYWDKIAFFMSSFKKNHIEYILIDNLKDLEKNLEDIKNTFDHYLDNNLSYFEYLQKLKDFCETAFFINKDDQFKYNMSDYHLESTILKLPNKYEINNDDLYVETEITEKEFIKNCFSPTERIIELTAKPGAGKTTILKKVISRYLETQSKDQNRFPLYFNSKEFENYYIIHKDIYKALCEYFNMASYPLNYLLKNKNLLLCLDGFDQIEDVTRKELSKFFEEKFADDDNYIIVSTDTKTTNYRQYSIKSFSFEQKEKLAELILKDNKLNCDMDALPDNPFNFCLDLALYKEENIIYQKEFKSILNLFDDLLTERFKRAKRYLSNEETLRILGCVCYLKATHEIVGINDLEELRDLDKALKDDEAFESFKETYEYFDNVINNCDEIKNFFIGYYIYLKTKEKDNVTKYLKPFINNKKIHTNHYKFIRMLLLILEENKKKASIIELIDYLQEKVQPNYEILTSIVNDFENETIKKEANKDLILHMLDRGVKAIETGEVDPNGVYTFTEGANPYEELFYYMSFYIKDYMKILGEFKFTNNEILKKYLVDEALDIFGNHLEIKFFQNDKYIDIETAKKLKYAKSLKRKPNFTDIKGHLGIFEKNIEIFNSLNAHNITSLYVYPGVEELGEGVLINLENLKSIRVDHRNKRYYSELQCLIETTNRHLIIGCQNSVIPGNVASIGQKAWYGCKALKTINIPYNVLSIGNKAFYKCSNLVSIQLGNSLKSISEECFSNCTSLVKVALPNGIKTIGKNAFESCHSLKEVYIPKSVDNIGEDAFLDCPKLRVFNVDRLNKVYYSEKSFLIDKVKNNLIQSFNETELPKKVRCISKKAYNYSNISIVNFPDDVREIKEYAFYYCDKIESINISRNVGCIERKAFYNSISSLKKITCDKHNKVYSLQGESLVDKKNKALVLSTKDTLIPENVEIIYEGAMVGLKDVKVLYIPKKIIEIEDNSINNLPNLTTITVDKQNDHYYSSFNTLIEKKSNRLILGCRTSIIPDTVTAICSRAFEGCDQLRNILLPESLERIDKYAFAGCKQIKKIIIPGKTYIIQRGAFERCLSLEEIHLPKSIKSIEWYAFSTCPNIKRVYYEGSKEDFEEIRVGSHNDDLLNIDIIYNQK